MYFNIIAISIIAINLIAISIIAINLVTIINNSCSALTRIVRSQGAPACGEEVAPMAVPQIGCACVYIHIYIYIYIEEYISLSLSLFIYIYIYIYIARYIKAAPLSWSSHSRSQAPD